ncbi:hypothetical protein Tco_1250035 [Tanacetum coccineum]
MQNIHIKDASKQGRRIEDIDADAEVTLVNETQERRDEDLMFDTRVLDGDEMFVDAKTGEKDEQSTKINDSTAGEAVTTVGVEDSATPIIQVSTADIGDEGVTAAKIDKFTLDQTLIEIKATKPKVVITTTTTTTTTRPKARGVIVLEPSEFKTSPEVQPSKSKDKGKAIMIELEVPLKMKDQVALDEDLARNIQAQLDTEIIEEERLERQKQEEANIALIESWENTQAMIEADRLLAERLQKREREELTDEEKGKLFMEGSKNPLHLLQGIRKVLDLEKAKYDQAIEIAKLKKRVDKLEKRRKFRTTGLNRIKKVGAATRIESSNDSLGAQEDASKQGRRIEDIDADAEMFVDATTSEKDEQSTKINDSTASETVTTAGVEDIATSTIQVSTTDIGDEGVTSAKIETITSAMIEPEVPLKRKDQVALDEDLERNIQAQLDAEIIEEERLERQKQEESNID